MNELAVTGQQRARQTMIYVNIALLLIASAPKNFVTSL